MNLNKTFGKNVTYDDIKKAKKQRFTPSSDSIYFKIYS